MGLKIFESIINENRGNIVDVNNKNEKLDQIGENEYEKNTLLCLLPEELRERSLRENYSIDHLKEIVEFREKKGFKVVAGFHVSDKEFPIGGELEEGRDGEVHFSTDIKSLYLGKTPRWLYAIECSEKCMKPNDTGLNWYTLKGAMRITDKIKMTPENVDALGVGYANCDYS